MRFPSSLRSFQSILSGGLIVFLSFFLPEKGFSNDSKKEELVLQPLALAEGLKVDLFASAPLLFNPVAFTIDDQGRFFISETHRYKDSIFDIWAADQRWKDADASFKTVADRAAFLEKEFADNPEHLTKDSEIIRFVADLDGDKKADFSSVFADGFNLPVSGTAAGVLAVNGQLWFTNIPDLWRFEYDSSGKQTAADLLHTGYGVHIGVSGHDLHGLVMGPDGKIYFTVGDRGARVKTAEGTLIDLPNTGAAFRCDPDGSNLEVVAIGLRNPQDLTFDRYGNLWTHDNDTAGKDKCRMIHIVEGADYGWRYSYQFMKGFGPWVQESVWAGEIDDVMPNAGYGAQGPAGIAYYPGVGLPEKYDHHFLACDFPRGVLSYTVHPRGASYQIGETERFIWNAGITDVNFGPDGDVYFSDWGRSYQMPDGGYIYRVYDPAQTENPALSEMRKILGDGMTNRPLPELKSLLSHADMRVRQASQFELIKRASESTDQLPLISNLLQEVALNPENLYARLHSIWALERLKPDDSEKTIAKLLADDHPEIRAQAAKLVGGTGWQSFAPELTALLQDPEPRTRMYAAANLAKLASDNGLSPETWFKPLLRFLHENNDSDAYLTHAGMMLLLAPNDFSLLQKAAKDDSAAVRRVALLGMRRLNSPEITLFLNDPDERNRYEAIRAINDQTITEAMPDTAKWLEKDDLPEKFLSRLININFRLGTSENAERLATFAAKPDAPEAARIEAIAAMGDWENPAPRDRVTGFWLPLESREIGPVRDIFTSTATEILRDAPEKVRISAVQTATALNARETGETLFTLLESPDTSVALRQAIPPALVKFKFPRLTEMMALLLQDKNLGIRRSGVELLDQVTIPETATLLANLIETETDIRLSQAAISTLGRLNQPQADTAIARLLDQMTAGNLRNELHLDLMEAAEKRSAPAVTEALKRYSASFQKSEKSDDFRTTLVGGDAALGKKLFHERDDLGCLRCHSVTKETGKVGPDLSDVGAKRSRLYLLESILEPNRHFAPGYELVVLELKNGETIAGTVENETDSGIAISHQEKTVTIPKSEIRKRHPSISAMPSGLENMMTRRELRDLIEYLAHLKN